MVYYFDVSVLTYSTDKISPAHFPKGLHREGLSGEGDGLSVS